MSIKTKSNYNNSDSQSISALKSSLQLDLETIAQEISYESALFVLMKLILDKNNEIVVKDNQMIVPDYQKEVISNINFLFLFICSTQLRFIHDKINSKVIIDFNFLNRELSLIF